MKPTRYGRLDLTFSQLWYEHQFVRDRVLLRVGKINPFAVFDYNKFKSPRTGFLGQPQNANPTIPYPSSALGFGGSVRMNNGVYLVAGAFDANGVPTRSGFDTLFDVGEYFAMAEIGWAPDFVEGAVAGTDYQPGNDDYHLTLWHVDKRVSAGRPEGWGYTASAQKGFGNVVGFARYGTSNGGGQHHCGKWRT